MNNRILGLDVARALAVIGMIVVNFKVVFGDSGNSWLKSFSGVFDGKAAATFVVLAGIGLALMTNNAIENQNKEKLQVAKKRIAVRAICLFIIGISYIWIWPADILHFYGVYMLLALLFISSSKKQILIGASTLIFIYPVLILIWNYENGWDFSTLEYVDFWSVAGFVRNLFYNGFHPVIPWAAFMLIGLWFGKHDLNDDKFIKNVLKVSVITFFTIQVISYGAIQVVSGGDIDVITSITPILGTSPMPPLPIYMLNGIFAALTVISACIIISKRYEKNYLIVALNKTGKLALTFYVAHVIIGMGVVEEVGSLKLGEYPIEFSITYALIFSALCIIFAVLWLRYKTIGPVEWLMRKATG